MDNASKHSEYYGNVIERYKQIKDDEVQMAKDIEEQQNKLMEGERETISQLYDVEGDELDRLMEGYAEDKLGEYLVDGAILKCTKATIGSFNIGQDKTISLNIEPAEEEERVQTTLRVLENPLSINEIKYATTKDALMYLNVSPFRCNCELTTDRPNEIHNILEDEECSREGVCKHLMELSSEWENMPLNEKNYLNKTDISPSLVGCIGLLLTPNKGEEVETEGITMTSILFCKHGGIIYPKTSGQIRSMEEALAYMDLYLQGEMSEAEIEKYIIYVSQHCKQSIAKIVSGDMQGRDIQNNLDKYILAWSYYWNSKIMDGAFGDGRITIRPDVVKAMIMDESSWGTDPSHNGLNDVMQSLLPGDYALWILSGYDPTIEGRSHQGSSEQVVFVVNGEEYLQASMRSEFNYFYDDKGTITMTAHDGFGDGLGILRNNVLSIIGESGEEVPLGLENFKGEYLIHYDAETPNMSIACGIGYLASNIEKEKSERGGVAAYNGGGAEEKTGEPYVDKINRCLGELGYDDGSPVELLRY